MNPVTQPASDTAALLGRYNFPPETAEVEAKEAARASEFDKTWDNAPQPWQKDFLELFLKNQIRVALAMPLLSILLAAMSVLWVPIFASACWLAATLGCQAIQVYLCTLYFKRPRGGEEQRDWVGKIAASELLIGISWVLPLFLFWESANQMQSIYLVASVMAAIAVRLLVVNSFMPVLIAGTGVMTIGVALRCVAEAEPLFLALGTMIIALESFFLFVARQLQETTRDMLIFKAEKERLVGELQRERDRAEEAKTRAEDANKAKSAFLATMSHELRTPLNAILGFSEILKGELFGPMNVPAYKTYAGDIHQSGGYLLSLINDILDLSRIEAGRRDLRDEPLVVSDLIDDARYLLRIKAKDRNITIDDTPPGPLPKLLADRRAVNQVMINLLTNAIKFTPPGGRVAITAQRNPMGDLDISVSDNGPGIPPQEIEAAMNAFARGTLATKEAVEGAGLGLPICKGIMELHGGAISIRSMPGEGTVVTATFPGRRVLDGPRGEVMASPTVTDGQRKLMAITG
jgi:two-component system cell cycle sensor histidine kinase PleC